MANSMFSKDPDPQMGLFDGFDPKAIYQMIPVLGTRRGFKLTSQTEPVTVTFEPKNIARFANPRSFAPPTNTPLEDHFMRLGPKTVARFDLFGQAEGQTILTVKNSRGIPVDSMIVSVKKELPKSYSLVILSDMRHRSPWLPANDPNATVDAAGSILRPMMENVKTCYRQQANVIFSEKGSTIFDMNVNDRNLGDKIVMDSIVDGKLMTALLVEKIPIMAFSADFVIIFTWDIKLKSMEIVGFDPGFGPVCYVEFNGSNPKENGLTTAHELGHALGLRHNGRDVLMAGDGVSRSSLLQQFEIDTVNKSATIA